MYQVYCDGQLLHDPRMQEYQLVSPVLSLELNKTGSFTFTQYPDHPMAGKIQKLKSVIEVKKDGAVLFRGRPLSSKEGFYRQQDYTCEGELAFLLDSRVRPFEMAGGVTELFTYLINQHNEQVDEYKRFKVGTVTVTDPNDYINRSNITYETTWDILNTRLLDTLGGYLWVRHEVDGVYLDYLEDFPYMSSQRITFGENLLDYARTRDGSEIATALIPLGARLEDEEGNQTDERLTIAEVNGGKDYVYDEAAVTRYGWIFTTQTWDDVTQPGNLKKKGLDALQEAVKTVETIEMTSADLSQMDKSYDDFRIGQYVLVDSPPHGIKGDRFLDTKMTLYLSDPSQNKLTFGRVRSTFTQESNHTNQTVGDLVNRTEKIEKDYVTSSAMQQVVNSATDWLTNGEGYKVERRDDAGNAIDTLYMDTPDINTAKNVLRIGQSGIGFSYTGVNGPYLTAWTIDGKFVADFITAGTINAALVKIINLIVDHLISQSGNYELEAWAATLSIKNNDQLRLKQYCTSTDIGLYQCFSGNVDNTGTLMDNTARYSFLTPESVGVGQDKDGVYHGTVYAETVSFSKVKPKSDQNTLNTDWKRATELTDNDWVLVGRDVQTQEENIPKTKEVL